MGRVFDIPARRLEARMSILDTAQVNNRHAIFPLDYTIEPRPLSQTNNEYIEHAVKLGREAAEKCLERAGLKPDQIDMIITVSCTGFMIPSLDAHLINLMGFRSNVRRMPFTELGCAAGAMALGRAADFLKAEPGGNVLIIAVELPSLTFQRKDISTAIIRTFPPGSAFRKSAARPNAIAPAAQPSSVNGMRRTFERNPIRLMRWASSDGIMKPVQDTVMIMSISSGFKDARSRHFSAASRPSFTACSIYSSFVCYTVRGSMV